LAAACRAEFDGRRIFPIIFRLPPSVVLVRERDREAAYVRSVAAAAAWELLLYLAYHPWIFFSLDVWDRAVIKALLNRDLPVRLKTLLEQVEAPGDLGRLAEDYDPTAYWSSPPSPGEFGEFRDAFLAQAPAFGTSEPVSIELWQKMLLETLGFEAIYLLLDGVDAYPETLSQPEQTTRLLGPLWRLARTWSFEGMYLKAFLPIELKDEAALRDLTPRPTIVIISWNVDRLHQMLQLRLEAASPTGPDSLDGLASLNLPGLQADLVEAVESTSPLPRNLLELVERLFFEHVRRAGTSGPINAQDVEAALASYARQHSKGRANSLPA
jgi:hypothetical protein